VKPKEIAEAIETVVGWLSEIRKKHNCDFDRAMLIMASESLEVCLRQNEQLSRRVAELEAKINQAFVIH
jgi:hypothetical protein